jgi:SUMO ligase MMS21 Smc5/6 complex component
MKKVILIITILMFISCSTENNAEKENISSLKDSKSDVLTQQLLSEDSNFIELVVEMESFKNYAKEIIKNNNLDINNVQSELNSLNGKIWTMKLK